MFFSFYTSFISPLHPLHLILQLYLKMRSAQRLVLPLTHRFKISVSLKKLSTFKVFSNLNLLALSLIFLCNFITTNGYSQSHCLNYFEPSLSQKIEQKNDPHIWKSQSNVFSESLASTIVSGFAWLTLVQLAKHQWTGDSSLPIFTDSFWVTLPTDIVLTVVSHALSLKDIPALKTFLSGGYLNKRYEYLSRTFANTVLNSSIILATWSMFGIEIKGPTIAAAVSLCAGVYAVLQITKPFLFKTVPEKMGKQDWSYLSQSVPSDVERWSSQVDTSQISKETLESHFGFALESLILEIPFEDRVRESRLNEIKFFEKKLNTIFNLKSRFSKNENPKDYLKIKTERRKLISALLDHARNNRHLKDDILKILKIDNETSEQSSFLILDYLSKTHAKRKLWLYTASFIDQSIAVGIAGGVFLYSTTHWVMHGTLPQFIEILLAQ